MALIPPLKVQGFRPVASMDKDSAFQDVQTDKGFFIHAHNITRDATGLNLSDYVVNVNGNKFAFTLPTVVAQNKQYSFTISEPTSGANTYNVTFSNLNYSVIGTAGVTTTGVIATDAAAFETSINSALSGLGDVISYTISGNKATFLLQVGTVTGFDWLMNDTGSANQIPTNPIVVNEAIDISLAGLCLPIGGIEYLGDLFIFSSSAVNQPQVFNIVSTTNVGSEIIVIIAGNVTSEITVGEYVNISGVTGGTQANGLWIVQAVNFTGGNTQINLYGSTYVSAGTGGTLTTNIFGYLAITECNKNLSTGVWTITNLLGTKGVNSRFYHPIRKEINANRNNDITSIYFTDGYDFPRIFSYKGAYITNGAIEYYNTLGLYTYDGIGIATKNIQNNPTPIVTPKNVSDSGGAVLSGNWRYAVIPLDSSLTPAQISILSNPVNIYNGSFSNPSQIVGTVGSPSAMRVTLTVSDIPENVYSFIQLIGINYQGTTETAYVIGTYPIPPGTTSMTITQTGEEQMTDYTGGFVLNSLNYVAAGTQTICSNTLLYGDLTASAINDFSAFFQTFNHVLQRDTTSLSPTGDDVSVWKLGEYQIPIETAEKVGYMLNETERFWGVALLKTGGFTPMFWIDDIRFDNFTTNRANPFGNTGRRVGNNIPNFDLSQSSITTNTQDINSYVFYVTFNGGDSSYLIDGIPVYDLLDRIYIFRTDNTSVGLNEVLGCGMSVRHVAGTITGSVSPTDGDTVKGLGGGGINYLFETPFLLGEQVPDHGARLPSVALGGNTYSTLFNLTPNKWTYAQWNTNDFYLNQISQGGYYQRSMSFYCPDWIYNQQVIDFQAGDTVFCYGSPDWYSGVGGTYPSGYMFSTTLTNNGSVATVWNGTEFRFSGATNITSDPYNTNTIKLGLDATTSIANYSSGVYTINVPTTVNYCPSFIYNANVVPATYSWTTPPHLWLYTDNDITNNNPQFPLSDIGLEYCQYYRDLGSVSAYTTKVSKFGAITQGTGIPTGAYIDITSNTGLISIDVWGGDTFNQKTYLRLQVANDDTNSGAPSVSDTGGGCTVSFFCQNRMNYNMRGSGSLGYPNPTPMVNWIFDTSDASAENNYDDGYTPSDLDNTLAAYNPALPYITDMPERIIFSLVQPQNSTINNYRLFPPLNFYDLGSQAGYITNLTTIQGELYTIQQKELNRQFYNERGTINVDEASSSTQAVLGSGAPFTKPPVKISDIGSSNNHGLIYGQGVNGEDILGYIDTRTQEVSIVSKGGIIVASLTNLMRDFFQQNLSFVTEDNPNISNGITGVWNDKKKEFIWTVIGLNISGIDAWASGVSYSLGQVVTYGESFEGIPLVYVSIADSITPDHRPDISPTYWQLQPFIDSPYYQYYTIVYSLLTGGFSSFLTPKPYFYVEFLNTYLTGYPNTDYNGIYEDNLGAPCTWYVNGGTSQVENAYIMWANNAENTKDKRWINEAITSDLTPFSITFSTKSQASYIPSAWIPFTELQSTWVAPIGNDTFTAPNGTPDEATDELWGQYLINTFVFQYGVTQKLYNVDTLFLTIKKSYYQ